MAKGANKVWVGFDLGGTKMMATVYGAGFKARASAKAKTPVNEGPKAVLARIRETIHEALKEAKVPPRALAGIGVAVPACWISTRGSFSKRRTWAGNECRCASCWRAGSAAA